MAARPRLSAVAEAMGALRGSLVDLRSE
jgi:hypothetical protein